MKPKIKRMKPTKRWSVVSDGYLVMTRRDRSSLLFNMPHDRIARVLVTEIVPKRRRK